MERERTGRMRWLERVCWVVAAVLVLPGFAVWGVREIDSLRWTRDGSVTAITDAVADVVLPPAVFDLSQMLGQSPSEESSLQASHAVFRPDHTWSTPDASGPNASWSATRHQRFDLLSRVFSLEALAVLEVPRLQLTVPVYAGTHEAALTLGAGLIEGTARPHEAGNIGIAAHRDGYFRALRHVAPGDDMLLHTESGSRRFRVQSTIVVEPHDVWVLEPQPEPMLTLVTCYPFYFVGHAPDRFVVRATQTVTEAVDTRRIP